MMQAWRSALSRVAQQGLIGLVQGYRLFFKAWIGNRCRFEPSCSAYALQALRQHGALRGSTLTAGRLLRCHPGCRGGHDPVPRPVGHAKADVFTRGLPSSSENKTGAERPLSRKLP
jgi:uncharacterized protein